MGIGLEAGMRRNRLRLYALVAAAALAGAAFAVLPALGDNHPDALRLHLGTDGQYFEYGATTQALNTSRCEIDEFSRSGSLVDVPRRTGLDSLGLGYKSGGSQGTPCGRVDTNEALDIAIHPGGPLGGRVFSGLRLDLELKGNAWITLALYAGTSEDPVETFRLATGSSITASGYPNPSDTNPDGGYTVTSDPANDLDGEPDSHFVACASPSDSGPDSGANDNCIWTVLATQEFDRIKMTAQAGEFSLEGGGDFGSHPDDDTLFYIANGAPTAVADSKSVGEDDGPTSISVLVNDIDPDNDSLTVTGVTAVTADPGVPTGLANYTASTATFDPNGQFEFLDDGESRTNAFTYTVSDGKGGTDTASVTVTINGENDDPVLASQVTVPEDATGTAASVTVVTDVDLADQTTLSFTCTPQDEDLVGVSLVDNGTGDGTGTFSAPTDFFDEDGVAFSCTFSDGTANKSGSTTVVVSGNPDDPTATPDVVYADNDEVKTITVLANDFDVDNDAETLTIISITNVPTVPSGFSASHDGTQITFQGPAEWSGSPVTFNYTIQDSTGRTDIGTVTVYEVIQCGEDLQYSEGDITATYERLDAGDCDPKPYSIDVLGISEGDAVLFQPRPQTGDPVEDCSVDPRPEACSEQFKGTLTFGPRQEGNAPNTGTLLYDPVAQTDPAQVELRPMPWCEFDPFASSVTDETRPDAIPDEESWCIVSVSVVIANSTETSTTWVTFGIGDPWKIAT
jgi:VCBS repeat-containing protein